jgi:hypothetical protein
MNLLPKYYSIKQCKDLAKILGYSEGSSSETFTADKYPIKGCYGYRPSKTLFYGTIDGGNLNRSS